MIVAIAAPLTPIFNANINIGSRTILNRPPIIIVNIATFAFPSALAALLAIIAKERNGIPRIIISK